MKNYLITGGTGMIGTQLVEAIIQSDAHITILTRQNKSSSHPKITYVNWSESDWESKIPHID
ncbi:epimerase, partial [Enterobacter mori]